MTDYKRMTKALSAELMQRECRLSNRQMRMLMWKQLQDGKLVMRQREVVLSETLWRAMQSLPCQEGFIFDKSFKLPPEKPKKRVIIMQMAKTLMQ